MNITSPGVPGNESNRTRRLAKPRPTLRAVLTLLLAVPLLFSLACGKKGGASQEIVFWQFWPADVIDPLLRAFEKEHPGTTVRMEQLTWQSGLEKITAAMRRLGRRKFTAAKLLQHLPHAHASLIPQRKCLRRDFPRVTFAAEIRAREPHALLLGKT